MQSGTAETRVGPKTEERVPGESQKRGARFVLAIDTCGPSGSVALAKLGADGAVEMIGQQVLEGKTYAATLVAGVGDLLAAAGVGLRDLDAIVVTNGPGSFTGVRVGLSAVKGLAEPTGIPVVAVSRLAALASKAGTVWAALDAHRREVFLRVGGSVAEARELLAGAVELAALGTPAEPLAVCDEAAQTLLRTVWPDAKIEIVAAPTADDALRLAAKRALTGDFDDVALLDGHYLRRSDAEIFGEKAAAETGKPA